MATTGFWPVKSNLKYTLDYAENPDKTTAEKYLDNDLYTAIRYVENDDKTDKKLFVHGINCPTERAYECMMATKQRYGRLGGNLAYHGYQSFAEGEVTPEECHKIGIETAKRMWGDKYEVIVTTHLNCQNHLHNHFVVNSVSFKTGEKSKNKIGDHLELRKISDEICREYNKSVLENSSFYGGEKGAYWVHKNGNLTHRDILKQDVEYALSRSRNMKEFMINISRLGYEIDQRRLSIKAPSWERSVRLSNIGYTESRLIEIFNTNYYSNETLYLIQFKPIPKPKKSIIEKYLDDICSKNQISRNGIESMLNLLILLLVTLLYVVKKGIENSPLSPSLRAEVKNLETYVKDYNFMQDNNLVTKEDVLKECLSTEKQIEQLETERQKIRNKIRRANPEEKAVLKEQAKSITKKLTPLRERQKQLDRIFIESDKVLDLIKTERQLGERTKAYRDRGAR